MCMFISRIPAFVYVIMYIPSPAPMSVFLFYLHPYFSNFCVHVSNHEYAFPCPSIFIRIYNHVHIYVCVDYTIMTPYNLFASRTTRLFIPAPSGVAQCLHTCDLMFQSLYFSNHVCLRFLWMHIYHFHMEKWNYVCTCPLPYVRCPTTFSFVSFPST